MRGDPRTPRPAAPHPAALDAAAPKPAAPKPAAPKPAALDGGAVAVLAFAAVAAPLLAGLAVLLARRGPLALNGDLALMEIATREALRGERLLGPWGRFGWNHPGPAVFYLLALPSAALGGTVPRLYVAATLVNLAAALGTVEAVRRAAGPRGALAAATALLSVAVSAGPGHLQHPWNPAIVTLPAVWFLALCALAVRRTATAGTALLAAAVGSFLVQTHAGTAPLVAAGLAVVLLRRRRAEPAPARTARGAAARWLGIAVPAVLLVLAWTPVAAEAARPGPGNLSALARFFLSAPPSQGWAGAAGAAGTAASAIPLGPPPAGPVALRPVAAVPAAALALLGAWAWRARAARPSAAADALLLAGAGALAVCALASAGIVGPVYGYLVTWMVAGPVVLAAGVILRAVSGGRLPMGAAVAVTVAALSATGVAQALRADVPGADHDHQVAMVSRVVEREAASRGARTVSLRQATFGHGEWRSVAGVAAALDLAGYRPFVTDPWVPRYGERFRARGPQPYAVGGTGGANRATFHAPADLDVVVARSGVAARPGRLDGTVPLLTVGDLVVRFRH